jgi:hypothetical protein
LWESTQGLLFPWPQYSSANISQTGIHVLLYLVSTFIHFIIIIIIIMFLTASGLSPGGSGYYAYT